MHWWKKKRIRRSQARFSDYGSPLRQKPKWMSFRSELRHASDRELPANSLWGLPIAIWWFVNLLSFLKMPSRNVEVRAAPWNAKVKPNAERYGHDLISAWTYLYHVDELLTQERFFPRNGFHKRSWSDRVNVIWRMSRCPGKCVAEWITLHLSEGRRLCFLGETNVSRFLRWSGSVDMEDADCVSSKKFIYSKCHTP